MALAAATRTLRPSGHLSICQPCVSTPLAVGCGGCESGMRSPHTTYHRALGDTRPSDSAPESEKSSAPMGMVTRLLLRIGTLRIRKHLLSLRGPRSSHSLSSLLLKERISL
ncbi:hypothetical protein BV25DRAFT_742952 [Artomyces pyxidatus]|uniref:Uncharacterized protein n=1 Tax=Artomyces pyxidatus TaxID=48021 RepID=A0ACB8SZ15_9AGAM|nr:hypothetical protein BV25DRAFT_742952 [Artomyces pyxidatus]